VMMEFKAFCGLPSMHGAINDVTHIHIQKPWSVFVGDYFSFKSKTYNMQLQFAWCGWLSKEVSGFFVGLLGLMNDAHILRLSNLYKKAVNGDMFHINKGEKNSNLSWLLTRCTLCFFGWWFHIKNLATFNIVP
jgi:hypothetical protein